jgi:hypothetical protein
MIRNGTICKEKTVQVKVLIFSLHALHCLLPASCFLIAKQVAQAKNVPPIF